MSNHIVMTAAAKMPRNCWGTYRRVAVVRLEPDFKGIPAMISERAKGVAEVVASWERLNVGTTERCAYEVALTEAYAMAEALNGGQNHE